MTQAKAIGRAFSCTKREMPVRLSAESTSELPAMNPATQAKACSASTSEFRNRIRPMSLDVPAVGEARDAEEVRSAGDSDATAQTANSIVEATISAPPAQPRRTGQGSAFQRSSAPRVSRRP